MNTCKDCTVKYYAYNNTEFSTEKACKEYNALPRVYVVVSNLRHGRIIHEVLFDQQEAIDLVNRLRGDATYIIRSVKPPKPKERTIHAKLTSTPSESWWSKLFQPKYYQGNV